MTHIHPAYLEHERQRFVRHDAHRFLRPDWRRFMCSKEENHALYQFYERIERKYSSGQPRVPKGNPNGGQWTSDTRTGVDGRPDPRVISDAAPNGVGSGTQYAQSRTRGTFGRVIINGRSSQHRRSKHGSLSLKPKLEKQSARYKSEIRSGGLRQAPIKVSMVLLQPIDQMLVRRKSASLNFKRLALLREHSLASQYGRVDQSGTSLPRSVVRLIESAPKQGATPVVLRIPERLWKTLLLITNRQPHGILWAVRSAFILNAFPVVQNKAIGLVETGVDANAYHKNH